MRDYAEQIDSIRRCAESDDPVYECCFEDCNQHHGRRDNMCRQKIMMDAADAIEELLARDVVPTDFHERCLQLEIRKRIELEKQMPHWISVEDELPEIGKSVLLFNGAVHIGWRVDGKRFRFLSERFPDHPTHWMPLPEGPEEVEE